VRRLWGIAGAVALLAVAACSHGGASTTGATTICDRLDRLTQNDPFRAFGARATPKEIQAAFTAVVARAKDLVAGAPADIRPDAQAYANAATRLDSLMAGAGYDGAAVDAVAYRDAQNAYYTAADSLIRYYTTQCPEATSTTTAG
jgi:hypothetical protein